jgi:hypothetical protein
MMKRGPAQVMVISLEIISEEVEENFRLFITLNLRDRLYLEVSKKTIPLLKSNIEPPLRPWNHRELEVEFQAQMRDFLQHTHSMSIRC